MSTPENMEPSYLGPETPISNCYEQLFDLAAVYNEAVCLELQAPGDEELMGASDRALGSSATAFGEMVGVILEEIDYPEEQARALATLMLGLDGERNDKLGKLSSDIRIEKLGSISEAGGAQFVEDIQQTIEEHDNEEVVNILIEQYCDYAQTDVELFGKALQKLANRDNDLTIKFNININVNLSLKELLSRARDLGKMATSATTLRLKGANIALIVARKRELKGK